VLLGVLSDTHGHADACRRAVDLLAGMGSDVLVHCGDVGDFARPARPVLDELAGHDVRFVWGNNDDPDPADERYARALGLTPVVPLEPLKLAGVRVALQHGDDFPKLRKLTRAAERGEDVGIDLLVTGHSHAAHDLRVGRLRWINPGALFRARPHTVATVDLARVDEGAALSVFDVASGEQVDVPER